MRPRLVGEPEGCGLARDAARAGAGAAGPRRRHRRPSRPLALVVALLLVAAACAAREPDPAETVHALGAATRAADAEEVLRLHDADSRAHFEQIVRTMRARVADGEDVRTALPAEPDAKAAYLDGTLEQAAGRWAMRNGRVRDLFADEEPVEIVGVTEETGGAARVRLRTHGGSEQEILLIHEQDGWKLDAFRLYQESLRAR